MNHYEIFGITISGGTLSILLFGVVFLGITAYLLMVVENAFKEEHKPTVKENVKLQFTWFILTYKQQSTGNKIITEKIFGYNKAKNRLAELTKIDFQTTAHMAPETTTTSH